MPSAKPQDGDGTIVAYEGGTSKENATAKDLGLSNQIILEM
jgi:hypothetical protein